MPHDEHSDQGRYTALFVAFAAVIGLPFYLGLVHMPLTQVFAYSGVASTAMAMGQFADSSKDRRGGIQAFLSELSLWFALVFLGGGIAYATALIF